MEVSRLSKGVRSRLARDPRLLALLGTIRSARTADPVVALTFDDGPHSANTPAILSLLAERSATATFFVLGTAAAAHPSVLRDTIAAGHEVGFHAAEHVDLARASPLRAWKAIHDGRRRLEDQIGQPVRFFRPPYGTQDLTSYLVARAAGLEVVGWSASPRDFLDLGIERHVEIALGELTPGGILLLHDGGAEAPAHRTALLRRLLDELGRRELRGLSVGEVLDGRKPDRRPWFLGREKALQQELEPLILR